MHIVIFDLSVPLTHSHGRVANAAQKAGYKRGTGGLSGDGIEKVGSNQKDLDSVRFLYSTPLRFIRAPFYALEGQKRGYLAPKAKTIL